MDNSVLQELLTTKDPAEKAAIIAEYFFSAFPEKTIHAARQCTLFHWFDSSVIEALLQETSLTEDEKHEACKQLVSLPFVETLAWGYRYQSLTREGLLKRYILTQPELLQTAAHLASPAYKVREDDKKMAAEALFCYIVAGNEELSIHLLAKLQEDASSHEDWYYISNLLQLQDEAEQLPFVQPLPRTEQHWLLRGLVHRAQGKLETAITDCSHAILTNSESALAYVSRGTLYAEQQHDEQALTDYNIALRFDPTMTQAYINRGIIYTKQKRFSEALQDFDSALQLDPNNAFVHCNKGSILNQLGQYEEALAAYEQALHIDPNSDEAYYGKEQVPHTMSSLQKGEKTNTQTQENPTDSRQSEGMHHYLEIPATRYGPSEHIALGSDMLSIGRSLDNGLVLDDPSIDPHHAEVRMTGQHYCITDQGSVDGTFVNEQPITPKIGYVLHQGDMIRIGTTSLKYVRDTASTDSPLYSSSDPMSDSLLQDMPLPLIQEKTHNEHHKTDFEHDIYQHIEQVQKDLKLLVERLGLEHRIDQQTEQVQKDLKLLVERLGLEHRIDQQPRLEHSLHQQLGLEYGLHQQPEAARNGWRSSYLTTVVGTATLVVFVSVMLLFAHFHSSPASGSPVPGGGGTPTLTLQGRAIPGQSITLTGSHFRPNKVAVMLDGQPLGSGDQNQHASGAPLADMMNVFSLLTLQPPTTGGWVTVNNDGTFAVDIPINSHWSNGSKHFLNVYGQDSKFITSTTFTVETAPSLARCIAASDPAVQFGPLTEGESQTVSTPFRFCSTGSGELDWTSSWDQHQASWLQVPHSGHLTVPQSQQIQISASPQNLTAGSYTADVTFTGLPGNSKVVLKVTLLVI